MAEVDNLVLKNVRLFIDKLNKAGIHIAKAYIFGSYANGRFDQWSDIDVAVVSPQIGTDRFEERVRLTKMAITIDDRIEPLPFDLDSFVNNDPLVLEIITNGFAVVD